MQIDILLPQHAALNSFIRLMGRPAPERVDKIKELGVIMDGRMSFLPHIEAIISKSSKILGFIKRISRPVYS
jgi:hypothetical protein